MALPPGPGVSAPVFFLDIDIAKYRWFRQGDDIIFQTGIQGIGMGCYPARENYLFFL